MPRDNRCIYMAQFVFMSVVMIVWGSVGMSVVKDSGFLSLWSVEECCMFM